MNVKAMRFGVQKMPNLVISFHFIRFKTTISTQDTFFPHLSVAVFWKISRRQRVRCQRKKTLICKFSLLHTGIQNPRAPSEHSGPASSRLSPAFPLPHLALLPPTSVSCFLICRDVLSLTPQLFLCIQQCHVELFKVSSTCKRMNPPELTRLRRGLLGERLLFLWSLRLERRPESWMDRTSGFTGPCLETEPRLLLWNQFKRLI